MHIFRRKEKRKIEWDKIEDNLRKKVEKENPNIKKQEWTLYDEWIAEMERELKKGEDID